MSIYRLSNTNSDLTGGADFSKALQETGFTTGTLSVPVATNATETSFGFTPSGNPGTAGVTGTYTVRVNVTTGNNNGRLAISLSRINSAGTVQQTSTATAEQTASAGVKTFTLTSINLGTWSSGDRLRVNYVFRNASTMAGITLAISAGGTNDTVDVPWTNPVNATATVTGTSATSSAGTVNEIGDAVEALDTVQVTASAGDVTAAGTSNATAAVAGAEANATPGATNFSAGGSATVTGTEAATEVEFVNAEVIDDGHANVSGEHIHSEAATITATGSGSVAVAGNQAEANAETLSAFGSAVAGSGDLQALTGQGSAASTGSAAGQVYGVEAVATASEDTDAHGGTVIQGDATVFGVQAVSALESIGASGSGLAQVAGVEAVADKGIVISSGQEQVDATVTAPGVEIAAAAATIAAVGHGQTQVAGVSADAAAGSVTAQAEQSPDGVASVVGVQATAAIGNVVADGGQRPASAGGVFKPSPKYFVQQNAVAKASGAGAVSSPGRVVALGVVNGSASTGQAALTTGTGSVAARGIQNPTDEMLLMLLA